MTCFWGEHCFKVVFWVFLQKPWFPCQSLLLMISKMFALQLACMCAYLKVFKYSNEDLLMLAFYSLLSIVLTYVLMFTNSMHALDVVFV